MSSSQPTTGQWRADAELSAAKRLHGYLVRSHWRGDRLSGPDPGVRFNARAGRFFKSYAPFVHWSDELTYIQAQGYWILDNWLLHEATGESRYRDLAIATSDGLLATQSAAGFWPYPNPEWRGRIATVEGCFGALGLVESYARSGDPRYLEGALAWYSYLKLGVGFRRQGGDHMLSVNYFAHLEGDGGGVPNNATLVLWLLARLSAATGDDSYLETATPLVEWLAYVQLGSGELPYYSGTDVKPDRVHFLCHQYNAFEFMDLAHYYRITRDEAVVPMMKKLAGFLEDGFTAAGHARYDCNNDQIDVLYYTSALGQALMQAEALGMGIHRESADHAISFVLARQRGDGGFQYHSRGNYRLLRDTRSYPRYLSMVLHHLLLAARSGNSSRGPE